MSAAEVDRSVMIVDDQLGLLAALEMLPVGDGTTIVTTYSWQQRILGAFVGPRATQGQLQRIAAGASATASDVLAAVGDPSSATLVVADPRATSIEIARSRVSGANPLAAETIAAARAFNASVRFSAGNARGHVADRVAGANLDLAIWDPFGT